VDNSQALVGRLTKDPELRFTPEGQAAVNFSIANNKRWQDRVTKEWKESTSYFDIVAWRELAEHISDSLGKGHEVMVFCHRSRNSPGVSVMEFPR
jgi:single-strand DNA-binding protein